MEDTVVFQSGNIHVSKTVVRIGEITYPTNSISSVSIAAPERLGWIAVGLLAFLTAAGMFGVRNNAGIATVVLVAGAVLLAIAYALPHKLMFNTAGGETQALTSRNRDFLADVKKAIEIAAAMPG